VSRWIGVSDDDAKIIAKGANIRCQSRPACAGPTRPRHGEQAAVAFHLSKVDRWKASLLRIRHGSDRRFAMGKHETVVARVSRAQPTRLPPQKRLNAIAGKQRGIFGDERRQVRMRSFKFFNRLS
jgi:hypothetical protein